MMKKGVLTMIAIFSIVTIGKAQKQEKTKIKEVITAFAKAGDSNDYEALDAYLDDNYRVVMNRLFGSKQVAILPKTVYVDKIKSKEFGGDTRELTFKNITVNGLTASAEVIFVGSKMTFHSIMLLAKNEENVWKLVSDMPVVEK
ncbi:nuclear transport factor 2 family protein [Maribacter sp. 2-571]|uniref:nuclear transport factor 2 family protein n=1 Tax=Maribacter sp. 2-571 TaxID=3417569 RepID=UPI003D331F59